VVSFRVIRCDLSAFYPIDAENLSIMRKHADRCKMSICQKMYQFCNFFNENFNKNSNFFQIFNFFTILHYFTKIFAKILIFFQISIFQKIKFQIFKKKISKNRFWSINLTRFLADNLEKHLLALLTVFYSVFLTLIFCTLTDSDWLRFRFFFVTWLWLTWNMSQSQSSQVNLSHDL
jgi:hypothetical protein